jgi:hypothetical protein
MAGARQEELEAATGAIALCSPPLTPCPSAWPPRTSAYALVLRRPLLLPPLAVPHRCDRKDTPCLFALPPAG